MIANAEVRHGTLKHQKVKSEKIDCCNSSSLTYSLEFMVTDLLNLTLKKKDI